MKAVVFACLDILLLTVGLGSAQEALWGSSDELLDNVDQVRTVREAIKGGYEYRKVPEGQTLSFSCPPNTLIAIHYATYGLDFCNLDVSKEAIYRCWGKRSCSFPADNRLHGDPCPRGSKYLIMYYKCWPEEKLPFIKMAIAKEGLEAPLICPEGKKIDVLGASFGYDRCGSNVIRNVAAKCNRLQTCNMEADIDVFGDPCHREEKILSVHYSCEDN